MTDPTPTFSYPDVLARYDRAKAFGETRSLPEYSDYLNNITGTNAFDAGKRDGWWTRGSTRLDQVLENSPFGWPLEGAGRVIAAPFGNEQAGADFGRKLPRQLLDTAPLYMAGPLGPPLTGLLVGGHTYADTGDVGAAITSGATAAALPYVGKFAGSFGAKLFGAEKVSGTLGGNVFNEFLAPTEQQQGAVKLGRFLGSQAGQIGLNAGATAYQDQRAGRPFSPEEVLLNQLPFTLFDAVHAASEPTSTAKEIRPLLDQPKNEITQPYVPPSTNEQTKATLQKAFEDFPNALAAATTEQQRSDAFRNLVQTASNPEGVVAAKSQAMDLLNATQETQPAQSNDVVADFVDKHGPGKYRVLVGDKTVFVNGVEPEYDSAQNKFVFKNPDSVNPARDSLLPTFNHVQPKPPVSDPLQPELSTLPLDVHAEGLSGAMVGRQAQMDQMDTARKNQFALSTFVQKPQITEPDVEGLNEMGVQPQRVMRLVNTVPKSQNILLDMFGGKIQQDAEGNVARIGTTDVASDGWMNSERFRKAGSVPPALMEVIKKEVPEAFRGDQVNATAVMKRLGDESEPLVETVRLPVGDSSESDRRKAQLLHEFETRFGEDWNFGDLHKSNDSSIVAKAHEYTQLLDEAPNYITRSATARYTVANPKDLAFLKEHNAVDLLVRVPTKSATTPSGQSGRSDVLHKSGHFMGEDAKNILAFVRMYYDTLPDSRKIAHVFELQSDWAQQNSKYNEIFKDTLKRGSQDLAKASTLDKERNAADYPLLSSYETLGLRAAIQEALKNGAHGIVLSDGETAMMTEGHDKTTSMVQEDRTTGSRKATVSDISQAPGMTAAYDVRGPNILQKMTGEKGEKVELGTHQNAREFTNQWQTVEPGPDLTKPLTGSPVFTNPDGTPKTNITGRFFSFDKIKGGLSQDDTLSLKEAVARFDQAKQKEATARQQTTVVPQTAEDWLKIVPPEQKESITKELDSGATPVQAGETARLSDQTSKIDEAITDQNVQQDRAQTLTGQKREETLQKGREILDQLSKSTDPEAQSVIKLIGDAGKGEGIQSPNFTNHLLTILAKWHESDLSVSRLQGAIGKEISRAKKNQQSGAIQAPGSPTFKTAGEAVDWLDKQSDLGPEWKVEKRRDKFFVGKREVDATQGVSLDQEIGGNGTQLGEVFAPENPELQADNRGGLDLRLDYVKQMLNATDTVAETNGVSKEVAETRLKQFQAFVSLGEEGFGKEGFLDKINENLKATGTEPITDLKDLQKMVGQVGNWIDDFSGRFMDHDLRSEPIFDGADKELHKTIPLDKGLHGLVSWVAEHPEVSPLFKEFAKVYRGFITQLNEARLILPGSPEHESWSSFYMPGHGVDPRINIAALPHVGEVDRFARMILHESTHHLTQSLEKGTDPRSVEFRNQLESIRKVLMDSNMLPKKVKDLIATSVRDGHYDTLRNGGVDEVYNIWRKALGNADFEKYRQIVYGLQNVDELIAQTFSKKDFIELAANTQMPVKTFKGSVLNFFSSVWNKLVGGGENTNSALAQILGGYDNYLTGGLMRKTFNGSDFIRQKVMEAGTRPEALASRMAGIDKNFARGTLESTLAAWNREGAAGLNPVTNQPWKPVLGVGTLADKLTMRENVENLLAEDVPVAQDLFNRLRQDHEITKALGDAVRKGIIPGSTPVDFDRNMEHAGAVVSAMRKALNVQNLAIARRASLQNFTPEGIAESQIGALQGSRNFPDPPDPVPDAAYLHDLMAVEPVIAQRGRDVSEVRREVAKEGSGLGFYTKNFQLNQFVKKQIPQSAPIFDHMQQAQGDAQQRMDSINLAYNSKNGKVDDDVMRANERVGKDTRLQHAASDIALYINKVLGGKDYSLNDPFIQAVKQRYKLNAQDWSDVISQKNAQARQQATFITEYAKVASRENVEQTAKVLIGREIGMKPESARQLSQRVYDAIAVGQDPQNALVASQMLQQLATQVQPETFQAVLQHALNSIQLVNNHLDFLRSNPNYVSEQRFKNWHLVMMTPNKQPYRNSFDTEGSARKEMTRLEGQGYTTLDLIPKDETNAPPGGMRQETLRAYQELDLQRANYLDSALQGADPQARDLIMAATQRAAAIEKSSDAWRPAPGVTRNFVSGREGINMVENAQLHYQRANQWMKHRLLRAQTELDMMDPEILGNRELKNHLEGQVDAFLTPDNQMLSRATQVLSMVKLAGNFGNSLLESMQTLTTGMQALIAETGSVKEAGALQIGAQKEFWTHLLTKKWSNADTEWFANTSEKRGLWDNPTLGDFADVDEARIRRGASNGFQKVVNFIRQKSTIPQRFNDKVLSLSGFALAREKGMSLEESYKYAQDVKARGLYTDAKAQRPGYWQIKSRPVPQMMSALQTYTLGWFSQMVGDMKSGWGRNSHLTPTQILGARKAFVYGLAAQAVLAGALGLPGVGQGIALTQQLTGFDVKGWLRANLGNVFHEDEETGGFLTNLALRGGIASLSPVDPSNRAAISFPFVGVDPYKGFSIGSLTGALGSTVEDYITGLGQMMQGDKAGYQKLLPSIAKGPSTLLQGDEDLRDAHGKLLQKLSGADQALVALGITPAKVQAKKDNADALDKMNKAADEQRSNALDQIAKLYNAGQVDQAKQAALTELQRRPQDPEALLNSGSDKGAGQKFGQDWRRDIHPGVQLPYAIRTPSNEMDRLNYKAKFVADMGGRPRITNAEAIHANMMDTMLNSNPYLTVPDAQTEIETALRGPKRSYLPNFSGFQ